MGCQRDIPAKITEKGANYLLAVKGNQGCLEEDAERTICFAKPASELVEDDFGHGRIEQRKCILYNDLSFIDNVAAWKNLGTISKDRSYTLHQIKWKRRKRGAVLYY